MPDEAVGLPGDNLQFIWQVGWFKQALLVDHVSPYVVPQLNFPVGWSLANTESSLAMLALALPFAVFGGETFGYNSAILLAFTLAGWGMYLWVRSVTPKQEKHKFPYLLYSLVQFLRAHLFGTYIFWLDI